MNAITPISRRDDNVRKVRFTTKQFFAIERSGAFDDYHHTELLDGEIHTVNSQHAPHAWIKGEIFSELRSALRGMGSALKALSEVTVTLGTYNAPMPDIAVVDWDGDRSRLELAMLKLAIEVADSTARHDLGRKLRIYASAGVPEYWVVLVRKRTIECFSEPDGQAYRKQASFRFGERVPCATIDGLALPADWLNA